MNYAKRLSYLIDADGVVANAYEVSDVNAHAAMVLADLRARSAG